MHPTTKREYFGMSYFKYVIMFKKSYLHALFVKVFYKSSDWKKKNGKQMHPYQFSFFIQQASCYDDSNNFVNTNTSGEVRFPSRKG